MAGYQEYDFNILYFLNKQAIICILFTINILHARKLIKCLIICAYCQDRVCQSGKSWYEHLNYI